MSIIFVVALVSLMPLGITALILACYKWHHNRRLTHPLSESMRHPPGARIGQKLGAKLLAVGSDISQLCLVSLLPLLLYSLPSQPSIWFAVYILPWGAGIAYIMRKIIKRQESIRNYRLGYECELVVGQELNLLMRNGWDVFHDVPKNSGNIDHIVVGAAGVFAVETKGRSKRLLKGQKQYQVTYKNDILYFPNGSNKKTIPQARRNSKWASQWLSRATGQDVAVSPVVVLPGWYIDQEGAADVPVIALGYIQGYFRKQKGQMLNDEQMKQIVYQIDQKVRDLKPGEITDFSKDK